MRYIVVYSLLVFNFISESGYKFYGVGRFALNYLLRSYYTAKVPVRQGLAV